MKNTIIKGILFSILMTIVLSPALFSSSPDELKELTKSFESNSTTITQIAKDVGVDNNLLNSLDKLGNAGERISKITNLTDKSQQDIEKHRQKQIDTLNQKAEKAMLDAHRADKYSKMTPNQLEAEAERLSNIIIKNIQHIH